MKICDLTQFYSPVSGGVKRYLHEKIAYIQASAGEDEHVLIIPDAKTGLTTAPRSRIYSIHSPLLSRTSRYRALLNLRAVGEILERERPDLIEAGDPYQTAWKAIASGRALRIPVIGFYHSHFAEAYLRNMQKFLGRAATERMVQLANRYAGALYNRFAATLVPSEQLAQVLREWGVRDVHAVDLGVNTNVFRPVPDDRAETRARLGIPPTRTLLLYLGRLAPEKNVGTLFAAFEQLRRKQPDTFHLMIIGDGPQRNGIRRLQQSGSDITWQSYCTDSAELARYYRAADLFVHPGVQETFGLVALESQACGTPVVGIRGSYMDRIIFHEQISWATRNTAEALAAAIEESTRKNPRAFGAAAAREVAERHAWPRVFHRLFSIYREVCARYRRNATG